MRAALALALHTDAIDLVDLARAGAVLHLGAARDGTLVLEKAPGELDRFRLGAIRFWLEVEPILTESHPDVLGRLG